MFPNLGSDKNRKNRVSEPGNYAVPFAPPRIASFAPAHVALRVALRQGWFAFLPECLTLRATHVAYRATPRLLGSRPAPAGMCPRENPPPLKKPPTFPVRGGARFHAQFRADIFYVLADRVHAHSQQLCDFRIPLLASMASE